jgi:hypothetical protein
MIAVSPLSPKRIVILGGPFGSGKTEVAVSYALLSASSGRPTAIADLDIVNPYFRTSGLRAMLEGAGIRVVAPSVRLAQFDAPALPGEINSLFDDRASHSVLDVGGDPVGTAALAGLASQLAKKDYDLWVVVNQRRPQTRDHQQIVERVRELERAARLSVTGLVSNTHLGEQTTVECVMAGHRVIAQAATQLNLPLAFAAVTASVGDQVELDIPVLPIARHLHLPWEESR